MTEFTDEVEKQRILMEAEKWGKGIKYIHASDGVIETAFNNGNIRYEENKKGGKITWHRETNPAESLVDMFHRAVADMRSNYWK
jgi:hypothetical protein